MYLVAAWHSRSPVQAGRDFFEVAAGDEREHVGWDGHGVSPKGERAGAGAGAGGAGGEDGGSGALLAPLDALALALELTPFELQLANGGALKGKATQPALGRDGGAHGQGGSYGRLRETAGQRGDGHLRERMERVSGISRERTTVPGNQET